MPALLGVPWDFHQRKGTALADHLLDRFGGTLRHGQPSSRDLQLHHAAVDAAAPRDLRARSGSLAPGLDVRRKPARGLRRGRPSAQSSGSAADARVLRIAWRTSAGAGQASALRGNSDKLATLHKTNSREFNVKGLLHGLEQLIEVRAGVSRRYQGANP